MEPLALKAGEAVLTLAAEAARRHNDKAKECKGDAVRAIESYLDAALAAIQGLENEYTQLLNRAKFCDLTDPKDVKQLVLRIEDYLKLENLRPQLQRAVIGLEGCSEKLKMESGKWLLHLRPSKRRSREKTLDDFNENLKSLRKYLDKLEKEGLQFRKAGTGVGIGPLIEIQEYLGRESDQKLSHLRRMVKKAEDDRTMDRMKDYTEKIQKLINAVRKEFR